jgi:opacity protein-like surface antigen
MKDGGLGRSVSLVLATGLALGLCDGWIAEAQEAPRYELSGGYAYLRDQDIDTSFPLGWYSSFALNLTNSLGVVADVGGNYKSEEVGNLNVHAFLTGARYSFRGERITPYVEGLVGVARAAASAGGVSESTSDFAVQAGVGVAVKVDERISLRGGVDFRNIFSEGASAQEFRFVAGVSFGFGGSKASPPTLPPSIVPPAPFNPPRAEPPPSQAPPPASAPAPAAPAPAAPPAVQPAQPAPRPQAPSAPPRPAAPTTGPLGRARELLAAGSYDQAADAFRADLPSQAPNMFTISVGVYCDVANLAKLVKSTAAQQLVLVRLMLRGRECYGLYFGLFGSAAEAQAAVAQLPPALRAPGQAPVSVSRVLAKAH